MPKKILQDMVPKNKASLRDVVPLSVKEVKPVTRKYGKKVILEMNDEDMIDDDIVDKHKHSHAATHVQTHNHKKHHGRRNHWLVFITLIVSVVVIAVAVSFAYAKATVIVTPKKETIQLKSTFTLSACKELPCKSGLIYQYVQIPTAELHKTVSATLSPNIQAFAQGGIILYNNYSATPQKIFSGTKLTNTSGNIYFTTKTVTIPGTTKSKSGATTSGSISVDVVAGTVGAKYNILPTDLTGDFSVVAYKGTPKYTTIYGRINPKGSISGGFSGQKTIISSSTLAQAYSDLKASLTAKLIAQSKGLVPQGYIMYDNAYTVIYDPIVATTSDVGMKATFYGIMFKTSDLVQAIASTIVPSINLSADFPNQSFTTKNMQSLNLSILNILTFTKDNSIPLIFNLSGSFTLIGTFPSDSISKQLAGKDIGASQGIFAHYGTIANAHAIITPFWRHTFPNSPEKIAIITQ